MVKKSEVLIGRGNPVVLLPDSNPKCEDGFAIIAALLIVTLVAVGTVPLMNLALRSSEEAIEQRVNISQDNRAREGLEVGVYMVKLANGTPAYLSDVDAADELALARACEKRLDTVDTMQLNGESLSGSASKVTPITRVNGSDHGIFVLNKGNTEDERLTKTLVVSCVFDQGFGLSLFTAELAEVAGAFFTLNMNEF
ncbi:MAG: hypothetical protein ACON4I_09925 [Candidatus Puniceispirillaceae bacterium]